MPKVFTAQYSGTRCGICDISIDEGDDVCYVDDQLCHADCAEDEGEELTYGIE